MADQPLLLALDQGTSSSRAAVFDAQGELVASATAPLPIQYPADGWVEQHPSDIWDSQEQALIGLHQQLNDDQRRSVVSCGITNQRETTVLWRRSTGAPCGPALVWQDGRTADICRRWKQEGLESAWRHRTGLFWIPISAPAKSTGCWSITPKRPLPRQRMTSVSAPLKAGCCGTSRKASNTAVT